MKTLNQVFTLLVVTILLTLVTAAKSDKEKVFSVYQDKTEIAKVKVSADKNEIKTVIKRKGQFDHTYTKSLITGDVESGVGDNVLFKYNNKTGEYQVKSKQSNISQLKWSEIQNFAESFDLRSALTEDMKILRAVRAFDDYAPTRSFELAYVILTADESIYWSESSDYNVKGTKNAKINFGKLQAGCGGACDSRLSNCLRDVQPDQRIQCYQIADNCHSRCHEAMEEPPQS